MARPPGNAGTRRLNLMTRSPTIIRVTAIALVALLAAAGGLLGVRAWRAKTILRQEQKALATAGEMVANGKSTEALALVQSFSKTRADPGDEWLRLELSALVSLLDVPRLALIYERTPQRILADEKASILVARGFIHARKQEDFSRIRSVWRGKEQQADGWLALDSDALILAGKPADAEKLLRSRPLPGEEDATRLLRLALVTAKKDMPGAWKLLAQATSLQPRNPDLRSFRAQILEATGRIELARVEYVAALMANPKSPLLRDQLADFYMRNHNPDLALDTWVEALPLQALDFIWLKARFWSRVIRPVEFAGKGEPPPGDLEPLVRQIAALAPDRFFDATAFDQLPRAKRYSAQRQEVFWLRLLDHLQTRQEPQALQLLEFGPANLRSWDPDLAAAIYRILYFRQHQSLNPPRLVFTSAIPATNRHPFFVTLEEAALQERSTHSIRASLPPDVASLLRGPNAFPAALLAAGWREAALQLRQNQGPDSDGPEWLRYGFAQILRLNRAPKTALSYLGSGPLPPVLGLLRAEIHAELGQLPESITEMTPLAPLPSSVGFRASYLLALNAVEHHDLSAATRFVTSQPLLANDLTGKELLARLALLENNIPGAELIYREILPRSIEAKTWFARQAFSKKQWKEARSLTTELLKLMPDSPQLRENMLAIDKAESMR